MKLLDSIADLGRSAIELVLGFGRAGLMLWGAIFRWPRVRKGFPLLVRQIYVVGVQSMVIIVVSGLFIGMVLALQGYNILVGFGTEESLGPMVALSLLRELGPVVTALLFAGRAGSALTAEIGLMKSTEQLSSLEMMAIDPLRQIIAPRFLGWGDQYAIIGIDVYRGRYLWRSSCWRGMEGDRQWCVLVDFTGISRMAKRHT